jgi:hypothetical protein
MKKLPAYAIAAIFVFISTGCAVPMRTVSQPPPSVPNDYWMRPDQPRASSKAVALLYYAGYVSTLADDAYAQEVEHARLLASAEKTDFRQLQYALALSVPGGETRKAQQIIDGLLKENKFADPELAALAQMVSASLAERRRLEAGSRKAEVGAKRADELEKQVEAIKNIEKNLIQRDQGTVDKK